MKKINFYLLTILIIFGFCSKVSAQDFEDWLSNFKNYALQKGISENTINNVMNNVKYLPDVIKYDRYQPEFYENTKTYVNKRSSKRESSLIAGSLYKLNIFWNFSGVACITTS